MAEELEGGVNCADNKKEGRKGDYRRVTLMPTLYKIYTWMLAKKLRKEVEEKGVIPQTQIGFRKEMGTMDNVYVINYG